MKRSAFLAAAVVSLASFSLAAERDPLEPPDLGRYLRWGPVRVRPSFHLTNLGYDDNVYSNTSTDPVGDYTGTLSGRADGLVLFGRRAFLTAAARLDYTAYATQRSQNFSNRYLSGRATVPFQGFGVFADFAWNRYFERPYEQLDARTEVFENRLDGGFLLKLGWRTDAEIGTLRTSWSYEDPNNPDIGRSLDRTEEGARISLRYLALGRTRLLLEASRREVTFDNPETGRDASDRRLLPGVDFGTGGRLSGLAKIGWGRLDPVRADVPDFSGAIGEVKLAYRLRSGTRLLAEGKRDVRFAIYDRDVYYNIRSYDARAIHYFGRAWGVEAAGGRSRLNFPVTTDRVDHLRRAEIGLRLRMLENTLGRRIEYTFKISRLRVESTEEFRNQARTVVGFGAVVGY